MLQWSRAIFCHGLCKVRWMLHCWFKLQKAICRVSFFILPGQDVMKTQQVIDGLVTCLPSRNCTGALCKKKIQRVNTINAKQWWEASFEVFFSAEVSLGCVSKRHCWQFISQVIRIKIPPWFVPWHQPGKDVLSVFWPFSFWLFKVIKH